MRPLSTLGPEGGPICSGSEPDRRLSARRGARARRDRGPPSSLDHARSQTAPAAAQRSTGPTAHGPPTMPHARRPGGAGLRAVPKPADRRAPARGSRRDPTGPRPERPPGRHAPRGPRKLSGRARRLTDGELDICLADRPQPSPRLAHERQLLVHRARKLGSRRAGDRCEQVLAIRKMTIRRRMRNTGPPRRLAQHHSLRTTLPRQSDPRAKQRLAQPAMMIASTLADSRTTRHKTHNDS